MSCSRPSTEVQDRGAPLDLLAADGGTRVHVQATRDPFESLDDLMVVVEALCPTWPAREHFGPMPVLRL